MAYYIVTRHDMTWHDMTSHDMTLWHDNLINRHTHTTVSLLVGHHGLSRCKGFGPLPMKGGSASLLGHQRLFRGDGRNMDMTREPIWTEDEQNRILVEASRFHPNGPEPMPIARRAISEGNCSILRLFLEHPTLPDRRTGTGRWMWIELVLVFCSGWWLQIFWNPQCQVTWDDYP